MLDAIDVDRHPVAESTPCLIVVSAGSAAACGVRRAACGVRRAACGVRRAACGVRRAACGVDDRHETGTKPVATSAWPIAARIGLLAARQADSGAPSTTISGSR